MKRKCAWLNKKRSLQHCCRLSFLPFYQELENNINNIYLFFIYNILLFKDKRSVLYADMVNLITKISDYILRKEKIIKKGVGDAMGGKVLELESERLLRIGKAEGETILGTLITKLFAAGRTSDAELAAKDEEARKRFYKEFGMID